MATTVTVTSNYAGTTAGEIIGKAFKELNTLQHITVYENINYDLSLRRSQYADGTRDYTCGHVPAGSITLDEKLLVPKKFKNDFEVCLETFRATWSDEKMGASAKNAMPSDIENAIMADVLGATAEKIGTNIWIGSGATAGQFQGFIPQFVADATVVKVTGTTSTIANVQDELIKALSAIPTAIKGKTVKVFVSSNIFQNYTFSLIKSGIAALGDAADKTAMFGKYMLVEEQGLPDNTIVIAEQKNLVFGTGLQSDFNNLYIDSTSPERQLDGLAKGTIVYSAGVSYYFGAEIVYYRP